MQPIEAEGHVIQPQNRRNLNKFVRNLLTALEDTRIADIIRWTDNG